jgi:hypothetical protein
MTNAMNNIMQTCMTSAPFHQDHGNMLQCRFQRLIDAILHEDFEEGRQRARVAGLRGQKHALGEGTHGDCNIINTQHLDDNSLALVCCTQSSAKSINTLDRQCHDYVARRLGTHGL